MIYDCVLFNDEVDLLKLRFQILGDVVDKFVIAESAYTFSGQRKPSYYQDNFRRFGESNNKVIALWNAEPPLADRWKNETRQRNDILRGLTDARPDDIIMISDADEIADPAILMANLNNTPWVFNTYTYYYFMDTIMVPQDPTSCRSIMVVKRGSIVTPQATREQRLGVLPRRGGWHFSYLGGPSRIAKKLSEFSHAEYDTDYHKDAKRLEKAIKEGKDLFDRGLTYSPVDVAYPGHPQYLVEHQSEYRKYLLGYSRMMTARAHKFEKEDDKKE